MIDPDISTADGIRQLCAGLQDGLLAALRMGTPLMVKTEHFSEHGPSTGWHGLSLTDERYTGTRLTIEAGDPALRSRCEQELRRLDLRSGPPLWQFVEQKKDA